jgi:hypothetical protein
VRIVIARLKNTKLRLAPKFITAVCDARKDLLWKESNRERGLLKFNNGKTNSPGLQWMSVALWILASFVV